MHILIAFITVLVSLLYALERLGIDIGWINPWAWNRKRKWMKQYHANPSFCIESPLEAVALLLTATAKIDGDLSSEEKNDLLRIFEKELHQSSKDASALLVSSIHLLGQSREVFNRPQDVLAPNISKFTASQKKSCIDLLNVIAQVGAPPSQAQKEYMATISSILVPPENEESWS